MRVALTEKEIFILAHIMDHFTDYMGHDDRPDHGLGILKGYREASEEQKREIYLLAGKLMNIRRKIKEREKNERKM